MSFHKVLLFSITILVGVNSSCLFAQSSAVKQAEKKIGQGSWSAAHQILVKALKKDSLNLEVEVALAKWFLSETNPHQQIDSAYNFNLRASSHFHQLSAKQKERLKRDLIDSTALVVLRTEIESVSFEKTKQINSEKSYNEYLDRYKFSPHRSAAIELRDEVAFLDALRQNSYKTFDDYIKRYPQSHRASEAKARYEKLLFESRTSDHKLKSFESFVTEFPLSPYKKEAEKNVFEVLTSQGSPADFIKFINEHPTNSFADEARNILFHVLRELDEPIPDPLLTDSLKNVIALSKLLWAPVYKNGKYGFIDSEGIETLPIQFERIDENYKCGSVDADILMTSEGLVSRSGKLLSPAKSLKDLGFGFTKVADSCGNVMHKSGHKVCSCVEDAVVLDGKYIAITKNGRVGLIALNGKELIKPTWQSIEMLDEVLVLDRNGKKTLVAPSQLRAVADGNPLNESFVVDEVRAFGKDRLLVRNGALEGIINSNLEFVVPLAIQQLTLTSFGLLRKVNDQFIFADLAELKEERWDKYTFHRQWLQLKNASGQKLFDTHSKKIIASNPDSLWFENGLAFTKRSDSARIHINSLNEIEVPLDSKVFFIKSPDSIRYFFVQQRNKKTIFSIESGLKMFVTDFEQIESLNPEYFIVSKKNKKGLINVKGKIILPVEYDILMLKGHHISIYKEKKFGLYDITSHQMIKPAFEKNLILLDSAVLVAFQNGRYGLIDWTGKAITGIEYDEIQPWAKGVIWAKKDFEWSLIDFRHEKKILTRIRNFQIIKNTPREKLAIVKQENLFGVVSSSSGVLIPPSFSFLMNLGNEDEPFYFTSKEVEEADIVVVIYYDKSGKFLRKQVYEDEEYARIVCPQD